MAWARTLEDKLYKDAEGNKVDTKDWEALPTELWNATTVQAYLNRLNLIKYGVEPVVVGVKRNNTFIKKDLDNYGAIVLRKFLRAAVKAYSGNKAYPTLSYAQAMLLYGERLLPPLVSEHKALEKATGKTVDQSEEEIEW